MGGRSTLNPVDAPKEAAVAVRKTDDMKLRNCLRCRLLSLALLVSWPAFSHATDSGAAAAAIAKLLATPTSPQAAEEPAASKRATVTVQRGENLDRVMRRIVPNLPFKDDFLRKAFIQVNSEALAGNPRKTLPAGSTLAVPTPQDLAQLLLEQYPAIGPAMSTAQTHSPQTHADAGHDNASPRRPWVRYP